MIYNSNLESARQDINIAKSLIKPDSKDYIEVLDAEIEYSKKTNNINEAIKTTTANMGSCCTTPFFRK